MDQKQRDKIAWVLAIVLGLVLIYLLVVNVFKVGKKSAPPPPSTIAPALPAQPVSPSAGEQVQSQAPDAALDPEVLAEQQQIAARLPRRNPFSAAEAGRQPAYRSPALPDEVGTTDGGQLTSNNEIKLKVTAIISRPGSNKRIAMINGKMLEEGDRIGEWTILKVNPNNVVLGNGAQQMVVGVK
ncbi:MAG: hypothetical protein ABIH24_03635 [Verrucomicrobiota bacterium]